MEPSYTIHLSPEALDVSLLPPNAREPGTDAFAAAVSDLISTDLAAFGLDGSVTVTERQITVTWTDNGKAGPRNLQRAVKLLREGDYQRGVRMLKILEPSHAEDADLHFNLGAALSDLQLFNEARDHLSKAIALDPDHINARTTLGLSYAREKRYDDAIDILEETTKRAPDNPFGWRALGGTLRLMEGRLKDAETALAKAASLLPDDPINWLGLGQVRESLGDVDSSIDAYKKCLTLQPLDGVAEQAEAGINRHTGRDLRPKDSQGKEMLRMDAVMYMREALDAFGKMSPEELRLAAHELAMAGQRGLNLKDSETTYQLRCLPGESTAMRIVSSMYAAFQLIMPGTDVGIDLSREYQLAKTGG